MVLRYLDYFILHFDHNFFSQILNKKENKVLFISEDKTD